MPIIHIPCSLNPTTLIPFSITLSKTLIDEEYCLDFSGLGTVEPFGMLFLSALIRQFRQSRKEIQGDNFIMKASNFHGHDYASWMGFFKSFGLNYGKEPGEVFGSKNYIPLTRLRVDTIVNDASNAAVHHGEIIEKESSKIASILTRENDGEITKTLTYAIREIMRNVVEHGGEASRIWYAAQYWPTKNKVEISILDEGIGLLKSLSRNKKLEIPSDEHALFLALKPGISGVPKKQRKREQSGWTNSGYGLYMTSSLCQRGGSFYMCSGNRAVRLIGDTVEFLECVYQGVAIRMVLDTTQIMSLDTALDDIRTAGESISRKADNGDIYLTASKMSRMLSRNI